MPAYDFELVNGRGEVLTVVTLVLPVAKRDRVKLRRRTVPGRVTIAGAAADPLAQGSEVLRSYHKQEEKLGSRFKSAHTAEEIKRAWSTPD